MSQNRGGSTNEEQTAELAVRKITANIQRRLVLDGIDDATRESLAGFLPVFEANAPEIIGSFYRHSLQFPETRHFFDNSDVEHLKMRQIEHWRGMLSCRLDNAYLNSAVHVGLTHHRIGLPLFLYLSGCNRILCDLTSLAIMHHSGVLQSTQVVSSIIKVVSLDMDIAISCYFVADRLHLPTVAPIKTTV
ncbi:hypothetical protein GCM10017083_52490 [Thalassobaculum fulvum]|uniref:Globin-sensor domain-containing protein n=1 Tax=Thalassobaculum fulvum TaxID=1633335 RepID=A0A918XXK7_9PROT|nr:protoglobin domain-containing protein [Thalassobaculum fulvum]GHD62946.1 hypothetical protein GCM10017083_52490 [Thalassobaculum fulvum]